VSPVLSFQVMRCGLLVLSSELAVMRVRPARKSCSSRAACGAHAIRVATGSERTISKPLATVYGALKLLHPAKPIMRGDPWSWMKATVMGRDVDEGCGTGRRAPPGSVQRARSQLVCTSMSDADVG